MSSGGPNVDERPQPLIAAGTTFDGILVLRSPTRIDGCVRGEIHVAGPLWIGEQARIAGEVEAESVIVAGALEGDVRARDRIELLASARVRAELHAPRLSLAEGCVVEGRAASGD